MKQFSHFRMQKSLKVITYTFMMINTVLNSDYNRMINEIRITREQN